MILVALFALAPCSVKKNLYQAVGAGSNDSLNKTRVTIFSASKCSFTDTAFHKASNEKTNPVLTGLPVGLYGYCFDSQELISCCLKSKYSYCIAPNAPPKYILFKRLKLDLA